ncbi:MAG: hypothetical protein ACYC21_12955 [Eubacteriales bacterium]
MTLEDLLQKDYFDGNEKSFLIAALADAGITVVLVFLLADRWRKPTG